MDDRRAGAARAIVEVDQGLVEQERLLDLAPVGLVFDDVLGRAFGGSGQLPERESARADTARHLKETATTPHFRTTLSVGSASIIPGERRV